MLERASASEPSRQDAPKGVPAPAQKPSTPAPSDLLKTPTQGKPTRTSVDHPPPRAKR